MIDSNVLIAANGKSDQANDACVEKCIDLLLDVRAGARLALDDLGEILDEYAHKSSRTGQPGVGDQFLRWASDNQYVSCHRVPITPDGNDSYQEFPDAEDLRDFDRSDRKFVVTALGCDPAALIYNAVDSDWSHSAKALAAVGVEVAELCPDCLKPAATGKRAT